MSQFIISGKTTLAGSIPVLGSKNAALPLLTASLLTEEPITLHNVPQIADVERLLRIMEHMGATVTQDGSTCTVTAQTLDPDAIPQNDVAFLRGSVLLLGALLGRLQRVRLAKPGGDKIGARPIDVHLDAFIQLGAEVTTENNQVVVDGTNMQAGEVTLRELSVTATENTLLAAARLPGTTTIHIAATEPHVVALADLLQKMGVGITGAGTHTIQVEGKSELHGATVATIPDMLEAGFFILMAAATHSEVTVTNVPGEDLRLFFKVIDDIGVAYERPDETTVVVSPAKLRSFNIKTMPCPGLATDLQAPFSVLATQAHGSSLIHDPLYDGRFRHVLELQNMGAAATICDPHRWIITGPTQLHGSVIPRLDIRAGATMVLAGLLAEGKTIIKGAEIIDRGYERLDERLQAIGAKIERVETA